MQHKILKTVIDIAIIVIFVIGGLFLYDDYKTKSEKIYVVDVQEIYDMKKKTLNVSNATESQVNLFYDELEKIIKFSSTYIDSVAKTHNTVVYSKNFILSNNNKNVIDYTPMLIDELKKYNLIK